MKCHVITAKGKIQDTGFRTKVEHIGRAFDLKGQVQNEKDGTVKAICGGEDSVVDDFVRIIKKMVGNNGTDNIIIDESLPLNLYRDLPYPFGKVHTDDDEDLGRKLDKANKLLLWVGENTSDLVEGQNKMLEILQKIENKL